MYKGCILDDVNILKIFVYSHLHTGCILFAWVTRDMYSPQVNQLYTKILKMFTSSEIQPIYISVVYSIYISGKNEERKRLVRFFIDKKFGNDIVFPIFLAGEGGKGWVGESEGKQISRLFLATWLHQQGVRVQIKTLGVVLFFSDRLWFGINSGSTIGYRVTLNSTNFSSFSLKHFKF